MNSTQINKQKQVVTSNELMRSFKATTSLANGLTKERKKIQTGLLGISSGKEELELLKNTKKVKEPVLTAEEKASKANKADIKFTGFNMTMVTSEKGKDMIERQRDSRRQRHLETLKESEKYVDQFYENFCERKNEIKERIKIFLVGSDEEIDQIMGGITDDLLLANEIAYVNAIWEKVGLHREQRKEEIKNLRENLDDLKVFQKKGSGGYLTSMRENLINIAFILEPEVDKLIVNWVESEKKKYENEHVECDQFYEQVVEQEKAKFEQLYDTWKKAVIRFHYLKQEDAIARFLNKMNSSEFVNPQTRIDLFNNFKQLQSSVFEQRTHLLEELERIETAFLTKDYVTSLEEKLQSLNEDAQTQFDKIVEALAKDMENTNEDMDIAVYDLKDFLSKNDAQLEEGQTFDSIIADRAQPTVNRRKLESKTLITNWVKHMEDLDYRMNEACQNIINLFKELGGKLDTNIVKLKTTETNYKVSLASCGDNHDEIAQGQEDELEVKVEEMRKAIHHVELNEKLQSCFDILDQITRTYRNYNVEYIKLVEANPDTMNKFYNDYEKDCLEVFKIKDISKRQEILDLFTKETEQKQKKLEEEALKKLEEDKKADEAKTAEEAKSKAPAGKAPAKAPPPKKGGKEPDKPVLDVPKLEVPQAKEYQTSMGNKYLIERTLEEIAEKLLKPSQEEDVKPNAQEGEDQHKATEQSQASPEKQTPAQQKPDLKAQPAQKQPPPPQPKAPAKGKGPEPKQELKTEESQPPVETEPEEKLTEEEPKFLPNDFLDKANKYPPEDPDGNQTLNSTLIITKDRILDILQQTREKLLNHLYREKSANQVKVQREGKDLIDKNVDELDENLRKQWPRKGKLEVEVYQERKSEITTHNKKYERQVRTCLEKYNLLEEQWQYVIETIEADFKTYKSQQEKLRQQLPDGKNLAELQGVSRREKDSVQTFEEKCREFQDKINELSTQQPDILIQMNNDMLNNCQLFDKGGNYSQAEIEWYRGQMKEINDMIESCKVQRQAKEKEVIEQMEKLIAKPYQQFEKDYKGSIQSLSAKEGLGKTYGQPRRMIQEKIRAEMTKCEQAQKGIDQLLQTLESLCQKAFSDYSNKFDYSKEKQSLSIQIRINLVSLLRCINFYAQHLGGFAKEPKQLVRISYNETQPEIELTQEEIGKDEKRKEEELEHLGPIGYKNTSQAYLKFPEAVQQIEKVSKDLCQKLYTGENAKFLVGPDKIPEYLTTFLEHLRHQVEEFKIGSVRQLRVSALKIVELGQLIPKSVFTYLNQKYTRIIENQMAVEKKKFQKNKIADDEQKQNHLKLFRPNLENPANKQMTKELNEKEKARTEAFKELIDDVQLNMIDIEQNNSLQFYSTFLNNVRALIKIYDCFIYKADFIQLPGDEMIEKKHQNIKILTAQIQKQDIVKRATRKWPGLGKNVFEIDFANMFEDYKDFKKEEAEGAMGGEEKKNEISAEIEVENSDHHKAIIKNRNENYNKFKERFQASVKEIMSQFDGLRKEENRFNNYWAQNLKEITQKHI